MDDDGNVVAGRWLDLVVEGESVFIVSSLVASSRLKQHVVTPPSAGARRQPAACGQ